MFHENWDTCESYNSQEFCQMNNQIFMNFHNLTILIPNPSIMNSHMLNKLSGTFLRQGWKCEDGPNLRLGSLEVFIVENQAQNSKCIMNKRLMVLWQERIKMLITKVQKKHKNITSLKLRPTVSEKRKLRGVVRKRGKVPLYPYFHPYALEFREC